MSCYLLLPQSWSYPSPPWHLSTGHRSLSTFSRRSGCSCFVFHRCETKVGHSRGLAGKPPRFERRRSCHNFDAWCPGTLCSRRPRPPPARESRSSRCWKCPPCSPLAAARSDPLWSGPRWEYECEILVLFNTFSITRFFLRLVKGSWLNIILPESKEIPSPGTTERIGDKDGEAWFWKIASLESHLEVDAARGLKVNVRMWDFKAFSFRILHPDPFQALKTPLFPVDDDLVQDVTEVLPGVSLTNKNSFLPKCWKRPVQKTGWWSDPGFPPTRQRIRLLIDRSGNRRCSSILGFGWSRPWNLIKQFETWSDNLFRYGSLLITRSMAEFYQRQPWFREPRSCSGSARWVFQVNSEAHPGLE